MAPWRAPGSQDGRRAEGAWRAAGVGRTPATLRSLLILLRAGFPSASERPPGRKCRLKVPAESILESRMRKPGPLAELGWDRQRRGRGEGCVGPAAGAAPRALSGTHV